MTIKVPRPAAYLTAITGVSGSGKSSLVTRALVELVEDHLGAEAPAPDEALDADLAGDLPRTRGRIFAGAEAIKRLVRVDQKPIGRTLRSNPATYTGPIRPCANSAATPVFWPRLRSASTNLSRVYRRPTSIRLCVGSRAPATARELRRVDQILELLLSARGDDQDFLMAPSHVL